MHFSCRSFLGSQTDTNWSLYWENEPDDLSLVARRGHLFGIVNLHTNSEIADISALGHQLITSINETYYSSANISVPIQDALKESLSVLSGLMSPDITATIVILVIFQKQLYFALLGPGRTIIKRDLQISQLLTSQSNQSVFLSGPLKLSDNILLSTEQFYQSIGWEKIKSILSQDSLTACEESFLSTIYSLDSQTGIAAALIRLEPDQDDELAQASPPPPPPPAPLQPTPPPVSLSPPSRRLFRFKNPFNLIFKPSPVYVSPSQLAVVNRRRHFNLILALILLTALGFSSYYGFRRNQADRTEASYQSHKNNLQKIINNAAATKNINLDTALELAQESQQVLDQMVALNIHSSETAEFQKQITALKTATGSSADFAPDFYYDTSNIRSQPQYNQIYQSSGRIYLLDTISSYFDSLDVADKSIQKISDDSRLKEINSTALIGDRVYLASADAIYLLEGKTLSLKIDLTTLTPSIAPLSLSSYQGSLYLLDSNNLQIWKFAPSANSFGSPQAWLKPKINLPANPSSMAINGNIWVLSNSGQLIPYNRGNSESFKYSQQYSFNQTSNLITTVNSPYLVFQDAPNLIYVIKKSGESHAKYNLGNRQILSLALSDSADTIFVLCHDQKIYKISI